MKLSFLGDICLSRQIKAKYEQSGYRIVDDNVIKELNSSDYVMANLESPITTTASTDGDHLSFNGTPEMLGQFYFIDSFSTSNNHINDCGTLGMSETVEEVIRAGNSQNGLFVDEYIPEIIEKDNENIAIITCTDMMNIEFEDDCKWKVLRFEDKMLDYIIGKYRKLGFFIILYAHVGILFSRFINPKVRDMLFAKMDLGVDVIVTVHQHCLGGMEFYKNKPIFYSIGDFVMDGESYRRRQASILNLYIKDNKYQSYDLIPTIVNNELQTVIPSQRMSDKMLKSWRFVTKKIRDKGSNYQSFFKRQYKLEMLQHTLSTLRFLVDHRGVVGMFSLVIKRFEEVKRMNRWVTTDRSADQRDDEAILKTRKRFSEEELY